jgi:hypothetical protein
VLLVLHLIGASVAPQAPQQQPADTAYEQGRQFGEKIGRGAGAVIDIVGICLGGIMILGGFQMKGLKSYGYALTGIISGMLPCHCCFLVGIGFGIWALVVINRADVKSAFG